MWHSLKPREVWQRLQALPSRCHILLRVRFQISLGCRLCFAMPYQTLPHHARPDHATPARTYAMPSPVILLGYLPQRNFTDCKRSDLKATVTNTSTVT